MHIIIQRRLKEFWGSYPDAEGPLRTWHKLMTHGSFENFAMLRETFPSADKVTNFIIFNIGGNKYRLITYIDFEAQKAFVRFILTHSNYDKGDWKNDAWYT